jgi:carbon-monoxide dehydrogenase catalytic subunit
MAASKPPTDASQRVSDPASLEILERAQAGGVSTAFSRVDDQPTPCRFGTQGQCCRLCHMGPCRITAKAPRGVCGADAHTIVARNFLREVAGGTAAHSDHGRHLVLLLRSVARGEGGDYAIRDEAALRRAAAAWGLEHEGREVQELALELTGLWLEDFARQESSLVTTGLAPEARQGLWRRRELEPGGIDRMVVESMHRTTMGVDHDHRSLLMHAFRTALADGWGGSRIATAASDILFGTPSPVLSRANLGVLAHDAVNVVVHGHEPALSEMLAAASLDPSIRAAAQAAGAPGGVNLAGICCTANEVLMRHGVAVAGNFLQQELAVLTGAVEMMIIDVQCCMPSLPEVAAAYHTRVISTAEIARTVGAEHAPFDIRQAWEAAKALLLRAVDAYGERDPAKVYIPDHQQPLVAGFSVPAIETMLGGTYRASFRPLNDAIMQNRILGVVGIVGCSNPRDKVDAFTNALTLRLLAENVLILQTGCAAIASAKAGLLAPEAALEHAGPGLREVCETVGMPPVLHMGSCVDNSRLLEAATRVVREGGLGDDISQVPVVGVAPEWMSEKAVAIGCYFVASGIDVVLGRPFHTGGSDRVTAFLEQETQELFGASFHDCPDVDQAAERVLELLHRRREALGIHQAAERKLMDMADRRGLDTADPTPAHRGCKPHAH